MRNPTYLFYDLETTDINPCFGQVLQFAAIRTDMQLNELERHEIIVRLNPDNIPAPGALIVNRIGAQEFLKGETEYDAIKKIHALFNTPGTISVGYNSMGFDDEFLRFSFYRNLLAPYTHQYANQCGRMDIYPITVAYYAFRKNHLNWPIKEGVVSLRLESLSKENQLAVGQAHNAMVDVQATVALAKILKQDAAMWRYCTEFFDKKTDKDRTIQCNTTHSIANTPYTTGLMIQHRSQGSVLTPVISLGGSVPYPQQSLWLSLSNNDILQCTPNNINEKTRVIRKKYGESPFLIPMEERYLAQLLEKDNATYQAALHYLEQKPDLFLAIRDYYRNFQYPRIENCDAAAALYQIDFPTDADQKLFQQFHTAKPEEKSAIAAQFSNPVHRTLASRLLGRYFPQYASPADIEIYNRHLASVFTTDQTKARIDFRGNKALTLSGAQAEINSKSEELLDEQQLRILHGYCDYLHRLPRMLTKETLGNNFFLSRKRMREVVLHTFRPRF